MELLQLKYFADTAKTENFSKTARRYSIPPSAVSQTIKKLEVELGVSLFTRTGNRISLNENGHRFYEGVESALRELHDAKRSLVKSEGISGEISALVLTNRRTVTSCISKFRSLYPNVELSLMHTDDRSNEHSYDILIDDRAVIPGCLPGTVLVRENIHLAVSKSHPWAGRKSITLEELAGERFISMPEGSSLRRILSEICMQKRVRPRIAICCDDPYYIRIYTAMNLGVALVPEFSWKGLFGDSVVFLPIQDNELVRDTYLHLKDKKHISPAVHYFSEMLKSFFEEEIK